MNYQLQQRDYSISFARFVAISFIILCHILQFYGHELAYWFNVGVQMFLFLSGYLYGQRKELNRITFYKKSFTKILTDYYIYIFAVILTVTLFLPKELHFGRSEIVTLLTFSGTVSGLGHFWFIQYILLCYLITPLMLEIHSRIENKSSFQYLFSLGIILFIVHFACTYFFTKFNSAWVNCYILGIFIAKMDLNNFRFKKAVIGTIGIILPIILFTRIYISYLSDIQIPDYYLTHFYQLFNYGHVFLGIILVLLLKFLFSKIATIPEIFHKVLQFSDKYSYDIYITHHGFIIPGIYGILAGIPSPIIGIITALFLSLFSAGVLHYCSLKIRGLIFRK